MQARPRFHQQRFIFAEQSADSAKFTLIEAVVFDNPPRGQLNENFIAAFDYMHMRGSVVLGVDYNIVSIPLPIQYRNHTCCQMCGAPGWLSSGGFGVFNCSFGAGLVFDHRSQ